MYSYRKRKDRSCPWRFLNSSRCNSSCGQWVSEIKYLTSLLALSIHILTSSIECRIPIHCPPEGIMKVFSAVTGDHLSVRSWRLISVQTNLVKLQQLTRKEIRRPTTVTAVLPQAASGPLNLNPVTSTTRIKKTRRLVCPTTVTVLSGPLTPVTSTNRIQKRLVCPTRNLTTLFKLTSKTVAMWLAIDCRGSLREHYHPQRRQLKRLRWSPLSSTENSGNISVHLVIYVYRTWIRRSRQLPGVAFAAKIDANIF